MIKKQSDKVETGIVVGKEEEIYKIVRELLKEQTLEL
jgi:hypothetical protein